MAKSIYYFNITEGEVPATYNLALKTFIKMIYSEGTDHLAFADCPSDVDVFYVIWEHAKTKDLIAKFKANNIQMSYKNITNSVLKGQYDSEFVRTFNEGPNREKLINFLSEHITVDDLLDKIHIMGIDGLTPYEKELLSLAI